METRPGRVISVDLLRGLVMVIMALDHTRDYFTNVPFSPENLARTTLPLFFSRFITHFCAPVFFLLAGTGAYLAVAEGRPVPQISRFLWTRGLWLASLEFTLVGFGWTFMVPFGAASILWALGWAMVAMAALVRLPLRWIAALGTTLIVFHNCLDRISPASFGKFSWLWMMLHSPGAYPLSRSSVLLILYPLLPWIGVMAVGYVLGAVLRRSDRRRILFRLGGGLTVGFVVLRLINRYGNGIAGLPFGVPLGAGPWTVQPSLSMTVASFFNTMKYPPSLDFLLMTLGPSLMLLAWFDSSAGRRWTERTLLIYGRVPLFYYVVHIYVIHLLAIGVAMIYRQPVSWLWHGAVILNRAPAGYGHNLPFVCLMWATVVVILYLPCRWYMNFKRQHRGWRWLSYL